MTGINRISQERNRQRSKEGWSADHDDQHTGGELALAAACYAAGRPIFHEQRYCINGSPKLPVIQMQNVWPFESNWYKPSEDRIRDLEKAGAMIAAEIDRLQRARKDGAEV